MIEIGQLRVAMPTYTIFKIPTVLRYLLDYCPNVSVGEFCPRKVEWLVENNGLLLLMLENSKVDSPGILGAHFP